MALVIYGCLHCALESYGTQSAGLHHIRVICPCICRLDGVMSVLWSDSAHKACTHLSLQSCKHPLTLSPPPHSPQLQDLNGGACKFWAHFGINWGITLKLTINSFKLHCLNLYIQCHLYIVTILRVVFVLL